MWSRFDRGQNRRGSGLGGSFGYLRQHGGRSGGSKRIDDGAILQGGIGKASTMTPLPHDGPLTILLDELHASTLTPPLVDLAGQCDPGAARIAQGREMSKERGVGLLRSWIKQVVGMDDEAEKTVFGENGFNLALPEINGVALKDVVEAVILGGHDRKFQDAADEEGLGGATAAGLRFEMAGIGDGHIVGKIEGVIPIEIAIEDAGTIAGGAELPDAGIDARGAAKKLIAILEEIAIVIEVVDIDFKSAFAKEREETPGDVVALGRNKLEGGLDAVRVVNIHEARAEVAAG